LAGSRRGTGTTNGSTVIVRNGLPISTRLTPKNQSRHQGHANANPRQHQPVSVECSMNSRLCPCARTGDLLSRDECLLARAYAGEKTGRVGRVVLSLLVGLAALLTATGAVKGGPGALLTIRYQPHSDKTLIESWTLTCAPADGTHPRPMRACAELAAHPNSLLGPVRPCPFFIIRGAPQAEDVGHYHGMRVNKMFRPGCGGEYFKPTHVFFTGR
jgi:hypothetical protein